MTRNKASTGRDNPPPRGASFSGGDDDFARVGAFPPLERRFYECIVDTGLRDGEVLFW